jgi:hypothetical protein
MNNALSDIDWRVVLAGAGFNSGDPDWKKAEAMVLGLCGREALALYEARFKSWGEDLPAVLCGVAHMEYNYSKGTDGETWDAVLVAGPGARECGALAQRLWGAMGEAERKKQPAFVRAVFGSSDTASELAEFAGGRQPLHKFKNLFDALVFVLATAASGVVLEALFSTLKRLAKTRKRMNMDYMDALFRSRSPSLRFTVLPRIRGVSPPAAASIASRFRRSRRAFSLLGVLEQQARPELVPGGLLGRGTSECFEGSPEILKTQLRSLKKEVETMNNKFYQLGDELWAARVELQEKRAGEKNRRRQGKDDLSGVSLLAMVDLLGGAKKTRRRERGGAAPPPRVQVRASSLVAQEERGATAACRKRESSSNSGAGGSADSEEAGSQGWWSGSSSESSSSSDGGGVEFDWGSSAGEEDEEEEEEEDEEEAEREGEEGEGEEVELGGRAGGRGGEEGGGMASGGGEGEDAGEEEGDEAEAALPAPLAGPHQEIRAHAPGPTREFSCMGTDACDEEVKIELWGGVKNDAGRQAVINSQHFAGLTADVVIEFFSHCRLTIMEIDSAAGLAEEDRHYVPRKLEFTTGPFKPHAWVKRLEQNNKASILGVIEGIGVFDDEATVKDDDDSGMIVCEVQELFVLPQAVAGEGKCRCFVMCGMLAEASDFREKMGDKQRATGLQQSAPFAN